MDSLPPLWVLRSEVHRRKREFTALIPVRNRQVRSQLEYAQDTNCVITQMGNASDRSARQEMEMTDRQEAIDRLVLNIHASPLAVERWQSVVGWLATEKNEAHYPPNDIDPAGGE